MAQVHVIRCDGPPTVPPTAPGQHWIDLLNRQLYISVGTDSIADWILLNSFDQEIYNCPATVNIGDVVYISGADTVDKAQANSDVTTFAIGIVKQKPTTTTAVVQTDGRCAGLTGLTVGEPVFLDSATAGGLTQTPPTGTGNFVQIIGMATNTTTITINIEQPIRRA